MRRAKLLILSPRYPWSPGGVEKVVKETALRLKKHFYVEIWCKGNRNKIVNWEGIIVRVFKTVHPMPAGISPSLIEELRKYQREFDIIHIHGTSNLYPLEALLAIRTWDKVVVSTHYHPEGSTLLFRLTKPIYDRLVVSRYLKVAKKTICVSNTEKKALLEKFQLPGDKLRVIYNGVDVQKIKSFKSKRKKETDKVSILYFGRLERYKNVHIAIKAFKYLPDVFVMYVVGKGPYENELIRLVRKLGLEDRVKFLGFLSEEELYALLHSVNIVINLSEIEAFGIMVVESLAAGRPVVVNNNGGLKELAEYFNDIVYPISVLDPLGIASLIKEIAQKRKFKARKLSKFDWNNILAEYLELYKSIRG